MKKIVAIAAFAALAASLSGCGAIRAAHMVMPSELAAAETIPIESIGYGRSGDFRVDGYTGIFTRSADRLRFGDTYQRRSGHTDFALHVPMTGQNLEARCDMREATIQIGIIAATPQRMAYGCDFTSGGRPVAAGFELREVVHGIETLKRERAGVMALGGIRVVIRSVHRLQGAMFDTAEPIGYVFEAEGRTIAALSLNGQPKIHLAALSDRDTRTAVVAASVALALFWDPANDADLD
jgi:hypothetical protein